MVCQSEPVPLPELLMDLLRDSSSHVREVVALTADRIEPFLGALSSFPTAAKVRSLALTTANIE